MVRIGMRTGQVYEKDFPLKDISECCRVVNDENEKKYAEDAPLFQEFLHSIKHSCDICYAIHGYHCGRLHSGTFGLALAEEVAK